MDLIFEQYTLSSDFLQLALSMKLTQVVHFGTKCIRTGASGVVGGLLAYWQEVMHVVYAAQSSPF